MDGWQDGRHCISNLVEDRKRYGRPICMHAYIHALYGMFSAKSNFLYLFLLFASEESSVSLSFFYNFLYLSQTCRMVWVEGREECVYRYCVRVCHLLWVPKLVFL